MDTNRDETPPSYARAGVDEQREQDVFARAMRPWLARTAAPFGIIELSNVVMLGLAWERGSHASRHRREHPGPAESPGTHW